MTDILYIVRHSDWGDNNELRYAIRSVEKHCKNLGRIFVCGDIPAWLNSKAVQISCNNPYDRKCKNIQYRLQYAINHENMPAHFLLSADDIFFVRDVDLDVYPHYWKNGAEVSVPKGMENTKIGHIIASARDVLQSFGYPLEDYGGGHCLHHIDRDLWQNMPRIKDAAMLSKYGVPVDLIMGGAIYKMQHPEEVIRMDVKVESITGERDLFEQIGSANEFSIGDDVIYQGIGDIFEKLYPNKSSYEK